MPKPMRAEVREIILFHKLSEPLGKATGVTRSTVPLGEDSLCFYPLVSEFLLLLGLFFLVLFKEFHHIDR